MELGQRRHRCCRSRGQPTGAARPSGRWRRAGRAWGARRGQGRLLGTASSSPVGRRLAAWREQTPSPVGGSAAPGTQKRLSRTRPDLDHTPPACAVELSSRLRTQQWARAGPGLRGAALPVGTATSVPWLQVLAGGNPSFLRPGQARLARLLASPQLRSKRTCLYPFFLLSGQRTASGSFCPHACPVPAHSRCSMSVDQAEPLCRLCRHPPPRVSIPGSQHPPRGLQGRDTACAHSISPSRWGDLQGRDQLYPQRPACALRYPQGFCGAGSHGTPAPRMRTQQHTAQAVGAHLTLANE